MTVQAVTILFTSIGRRVELVQEFRNAAQCLDIRLTIIGADITDTAPALAFCDEAVIVPPISDPDYIPQLLRICREFGIHALVPTIDTDLLILAKEKNRFTEIGTKVWVSAPEKIAICRDKRLTSDYFVSLGLNAPQAVSDVSEYESGFPAFIKPIDGSSSIGANRAENLEDLETYANQLGEYVIQPFVQGNEYTVDVFCDADGAPIYITPRVRMAVRAGEVLKTKICHHKQIESEMLKLIRDFKPCGPITVQLIRNEKTGINQYIEINPRFGGGAPLSMKAGADAAKAMIRILSGQQMTYQFNAAMDGAVYSRFDQSVCVERTAMPPIRAVVFDLDDTLYAEKEYVRSGYQKVAALLPQVENAQQKLWEAFSLGRPAIDAVLEDAKICDPELKRACIDIYRSQEPEIHLFDGVRKMLHLLRQRGIKIGIITDGRVDGQYKKIKALGLDELVDSFLVTDELGGAQFRKPNDIAFRIMQGRFCVPFEAMIYVGDNPEKDFQAPKALGMQWVYFENQDGLYSHRKLDVGRKVTSISELWNLLERLTRA